MKDAQKPDHISLNTLIGHLREGRYVIPDFQREFEWNPWDIRELMRSIFLDYYIGSLLLWRGKPENFDALSCESIYGLDAIGNPEHIVLDGQQRLTAMYYAFLAPDIPLPNRTRKAIYYIDVKKFMAEEYDQAFHYDWHSKRSEKLFSDREAQFNSHIFPLSVVGAEGWEMSNWVQGYEKYWLDAAESENEDANQARLHASNASRFGEHLRGVDAQYQISYIELDRDLDIDKVCDIFTQINSRGVRLDVFDLMNALLKPRDIQLKSMWRKAQSRLEFVDSEKMNVYILQVMSIIRQAYCSPKYLYFLMPNQKKQVRDPDGTRRTEILIPSSEQFQKLWGKSVEALESAIELLRNPREFGGVSSSYLPYVSILPVFAALQAHIKTLPANVRLSAQQKVRHWYWASVFTNRYSGAVESTSARDYLDVKNWVDDATLEPNLIQEFSQRFRGLDLNKEIKRGTSVYNGVFNLCVIQGARDWITGNVITQEGGLDDHHIVPASWGAKELPNKIVHSILNRTPMTAETNQLVIGNKLPYEYIPELIDENGEDKIIESHCISPAALDILLRTSFSPEDFEEFITERRKTVLEAIENLLIKQRLDLPPAIRELDANLEKVEIEVREVINDQLNADITSLPKHVYGRVDERIQRAAKRNAALDVDHYQTLPGMLEYCDLSDLKDIILSKDRWAEFVDLFKNKETLTLRFSQLANLRNTIRHSRTVDDVTRKDGEASLIWFRNLLGLPDEIS